MPDSKLTLLSAISSLTVDDLLYVVDAPGGTPASKKATILQLAALLAGQPLGGSTGIVLNGKFAVTVASNNLTVALKTLAGNDPSATDPVYYMLGGVLHTITAALSVTKNAGNDGFAAGSVLKALECDYFIYMGFNATDGVTIGFARVPDATKYSDFNTTATNDHFCVISTITNASANDEYAVVGRFAATNSGTPSYNWSVPTFTPANLIQRPIWNTRTLSWLPAPTGFSAVPTDTAYRYQLIDTRAFVAYCELTNGTSNATTFTATPPITASGAANAIWGLTMQTTVDNSVIKTTPGRAFVLASSPTLLQFRPDTANTAWTASGGKRAIATGFYEH
jgi:hypothetical protein